MITCIGNSHANFFTGAHPGATNVVTAADPFTSYSIGPVIAYNFMEHHFDKVLAALAQCRTPKGGKVSLIVGEVDCRWHLPKRINDSKLPRDKVVAECAQRFFRAMLELKKLGYQPIVWCGHPSTTAGHNDDLSQPVWGDCKTRNAISCIWRDQLISLATKHNLPYVDIINLLIDNDGLTKMEFYRDYCHLETSRFLDSTISEFKKKGLL